jgi:hypothetical protein
MNHLSNEHPPIHNTFAAWGHARHASAAAWNVANDPSK